MSRELAFFEQAVEQLGVGIGTYDDEGILQYINTAYAEMLGTTPEEVVGTHAATVSPVFDRDRFDEYWESFEEGETRRSETTHRRLDDDGTVFPVEVTTTRVRFNGREYHVGTIQDISDRKERERRLQMFREAVEHAGHAIYITDTDGTIEYANPAFETITGYDSEEVVGRTPDVLHSGEMSDEYFEDLWETILSGCVWEGRVVNRRKCGELYHAAQTIAPITDDDGSPVRFVAIQQEITEQKQRKERLRLFKRALDQAGHSVYITDPDGTITYVNEAFEDLVGYSAEEVLGKSVRILESDVHDREFYREIDRQIQRGEVWHGTIVTRRKNGERVHVEHTSVPILSAGELEGIVGIGWDITEDLQWEEQLAVIDRMLRHDLRNDLNVVSSQAEIIHERLDGEMAERAEKIAEYVESIFQLSERIRAFNRLLSQGSDIVVPCDLRSVVDQQVAELRSKFPSVEVTVDLPQMLPVRTNQLIDEAVWNVLENAVVHSECPSPTVQITSEERPSSNEVVLTIADDGPGISDEEIAILQDGDPDQLQHLSGVGLWMTNWILRLSGGGLEFDETATSRTVVKLVLPAAAQSSLTSSA